MTHDHEWPIYSLANYDNSGLLIELCRSLLSLDDDDDDGQKDQQDCKCSRFRSRNSKQVPPTHQQQPQQQQQYCTRTTSGYQTACECSIQQADDKEGMFNEKRDKDETTKKRKQANKSSAPSLAHNFKRATCELPWWRLIEHVNYDSKRNERSGQTQDTTGTRLDCLYQAKVAKLCCKIKLALSPFVSNKSVSSSSSSSTSSSSSFGCLNDDDHWPGLNGKSGTMLATNKQQQQFNFAELNVLKEPLMSAKSINAITTKANANTIAPCREHSNGIEVTSKSSSIMSKGTHREPLLNLNVHGDYDNQEDGNCKLAVRSSLSSARLRRLSWRQRRQINSVKLEQLGARTDSQLDKLAATAAAVAKLHKTQTDDNDDKNDNKLNCLNDRVGRSNLMNSGRTFSLDEANKMATAAVAAEQLDKNLRPYANCSAKVKEAPKMYLIDKWLKQQQQQSFDSLPTVSGASRGKYGESIVHILLINHSNEHLIVLLLILHIWPHLLFDVFESDKFKYLNCLHLTIASENPPLLEYLIELANKFDETSATAAHRSLPLSPAKMLIEQRVIGTLFKWPLSTSGESVVSNSNSSGGRPKESACCFSIMNWLTSNLKLTKRTNRIASSSVNSGRELLSEERTRKQSGKYWCDQLDHWPTANGAEHLILFDRFRSGLALGKRVAASSAMNSRQPEEGADTTGQGRGEAQDSLSGLIYFGQTPLAWSVCFKSRQMFELLLNCGHADVNSTDSNGNNCLHQLAINNQPGWTHFLVKHNMSLTARNSMSLTPFLLACHLGHCELFNEFVELTAVEFWSYSSVKCCGYPLISLDSIITTTTTTRGDASRKRPTVFKSAVSVILESKHSSNEQKSALLSTNVIKKLLEEKWKTFARRLFYRDLLMLLVQLLLMLLASLLRPARVNLNYSAPIETDQSAFKYLSSVWWSSSNQQQQALLRHICELAIVGIALNRLWMFAIEWLRYKSLRLQLTYNPLVANLVIANLLVVLCLFVRLTGLVIKLAPRYILRSLTSAKFTIIANKNQTTTTLVAATLQHLDQVEDILLIIASPLLWSSLLFFVAAFYVTGPFVAMINYMLMRDLKQFSLIYLIFLYSFAQCIFFINYQAPQTDTGNNKDQFNGEQQQLQRGGNETARSETTEFEILIDWLILLATKYISLWLELFKMTLGVYEFQPYRHSILSRLFLMLFMHLIPILFNMLIAMMNNTYSLIISQSERAWSFQWAKTLFALERRLSDEQKLFYLKKYSINLCTSIKQKRPDADEGKEGGDSNDNADSTGRKDRDSASSCEQGNDKEEQYVAGLMIIRRTNCTRAEKRRRLIGYWQKSIGRVLGQLKGARADSSGC